MLRLVYVHKDNKFYDIRKHKDDQGKLDKLNKGC